MSENKDYISKELENGNIHINEDVLATIAATTIKDVEGVVNLNGNLGEDLMGKLGKKNAAKGIRITLGEDSVDVECNLIVLYGHPVVEIARNVQTGVTSAIESMTGLKVSSVNVNVCGITMAK